MLATYATNIPRFPGPYVPEGALMNVVSTLAADAHGVSATEPDTNVRRFYAEDKKAPSTLVLEADPTDPVPTPLHDTKAVQTIGGQRRMFSVYLPGGVYGADYLKTNGGN